MRTCVSGEGDGTDDCLIHVHSQSALMQKPQPLCTFTALQLPLGRLLGILADLEDDVSQMDFEPGLGPNARLCMCTLASTQQACWLSAGLVLTRPVD